MTTIAGAVKSGLLELYRLPVHETRMPRWPLWIAGEFWHWHDGKDELFDEKMLFGRRTMAEHIEQLFCDLRCSKRPGSGGDLRRLMPTAIGVWSLHVPGVRLYGWSPEVGAYVIVTGALESETKSPRKPQEKSVNDARRDEVRSFFHKHKLPVLLGDIHAVYPPP